MSKFIDFTKKHSKLMMAIMQASLAVVVIAMTVLISIAIWTNNRESQTLVSENTNPSEKYFTYYAAVPNIAAEDGFDYYPLSTIPEELVSRVSGLAVARYEGFEESVQIPDYPVVSMRGKTYNADESELPVIHVLYGYYNTADNLGSNGFTNNSRIESLILPSTLTYVSKGAFAKMSSLEKVTVLGTITYKTKIKVYNAALNFVSQIKVYADAAMTECLDTLVLSVSASGKEYYVSAANYQMYEVDSNKQITYESKTSKRYFDVDQSYYPYEVTGPFYPSKLYIEDGAFTSDSGDVEFSITYPSNSYTMATGSRLLKFEWRDVSKSGNADHYNFQILDSNGKSINDSIMFETKDGRFTSLGGNSSDNYEAYFIPSKDISNPVINVTRSYYKGNATKISTEEDAHSLSGYTFEAGKKYKLSYNSNGNLDVSIVKYSMEYSDSTTVISKDLILDTYTKNGVTYSYENAYESYVSDDLIVSKYPKIAIYEVISNIATPTVVAEKSKISTFDLSVTNADYSSENESFEVHFSPNYITNSTHYYSPSEEVLTKFDSESLLNVEKIYYLDEVAKVQNEKLVVTYENKRNYDAVFIIGFTPISVENEQNSYYNGKEAPTSSRYNDCLMTSAEGRISGLYDEYGAVIPYLYDKDGVKYTKFYDQSHNQVFEFTINCNEGAISGIYNEEGVAITELYSDDAQTKIVKLYRNEVNNNIKTLTATGSLAVSALGEKYLEYSFDLEYGSPAVVRFIEGKASETVYPDYVVPTENVSNKIYNIYCEGNVPGQYYVDVQGKNYEMKLETSSNNVYIYRATFAASSTATFSFSFSPDASYSVSTYNNMAYIQQTNKFEKVYFMSSSDTLWDQANATFLIASDTKDVDINAVKNGTFGGAISIGNKTSSGSYLFTIPRDNLFIRFLRCDDQSSEEAYTVWNFSYPLGLANFRAGYTYEITDWGDPCPGKYLENFNCLVLENYYANSTAFVPVTQCMDTADYTYQFSAMKVSISKGTKIYARFETSSSMMMTKTTPHSSSLYTTDSDCVQYQEDNGSYYYLALKDCVLDIYLKASYSGNVLSRYGFWFSKVDAKTDFIAADYSMDPSSLKNADSLLVTGSKGEASTDGITLNTSSNVSIFTATGVDYEGKISGSLTTITQGSFLAFKLPSTLYEANSGNIYFEAYFEGANSNTIPEWAKMIEFNTSGNTKTYFVTVPQNFRTSGSKVTIYGFSSTEKHSLNEYICKTSQITYTINYLYTISASTNSFPSMTFSMKATYTGFTTADAEQYFYLVPTTNMLEGFNKYISSISFAFSGSCQYFTSRVNYSWGPDLQDSGNLANKGSGTYTRNTPIITVTPSQVLNDETYQTKGYYPIPYPTGIINESHQIKTYDVKLTVNYVNGTTYTDDKFFSRTNGQGTLNSLIRNQYINLDCNMNWYNVSYASSGTFNLTNYSGLYFNYAEVNSFDYYAYANNHVLPTTMFNGMLKIASSDLNYYLNQKIYFKSDKFFDVETQDGILKIINSTRLERNTTNTSYEEYYCMNDMGSEEKDHFYVVSVYNKDTYTPGLKFPYYGSSKVDEALGVIKLSSGSQLILFSPNSACNYNKVSYKVYSQAGVMVAELSYSDLLSSANGHQTFVGSIPVTEGEDTYFYIMSTGNNPQLIGRFILVDDGSLQFVTGYSTNVQAGFSGKNESSTTYEFSYTVDPYTSDVLYAAALADSKNFKRIYPYYLVGDFNNWALDNNYGLTYYTEGYDRSTVMSTQGNFQLGSKEQTFKYYAIYNVYLKAGQSYRICDATSYREFYGLTAAITNKEEHNFGFNDSSKYISLERNGYTISILQSGYYDIVFEEYHNNDIDLNGGCYYSRTIYRTGARINTDNLYSVDIYFQNTANWKDIKIYGYNSSEKSMNLDATMERYSGTINGNSNWFIYKFQYRNSDVLPDYVYFEGTSTTGVSKTTDLYFEIGDDVLISGQMFFTPKMSNNEMVVNVDNYKIYVDAKMMDNPTNYRYALYLYNSEDDFAWVSLDKYNNEGIYYATIDDAFTKMKIVVLNRQFNIVTLDPESNALSYVSAELKMDNAANFYTIMVDGSITKRISANHYVGTVFADVKNVNLMTNQRLFASFSNGTDTRMVEMNLAQQSLYYAVNENPSKYNKVTFYIYTDDIVEGNAISSNTFDIDSNNLYRFTGIESNIDLVSGVYSNYQAYIYNDSTPYLYYLRTSNNWSINEAGLIYDINSDTFLLEGVKINQGVGIKLFDASGNSYMISTDYTEWNYDTTDLYSLIVGVTREYTITATASVGFVTANIMQYTTEILTSFNVATAVVYDSTNNIVKTYPLTYTSNSYIYVNNLVYLENGYKVYIYQADSEQYTYLYTSNLTGYYKMFVNVSDSDLSDSYGWVSAKNSAGTSIPNSLYFVSVSYKVMNFATSAVYDGAYINISKPYLPTSSSKYQVVTELTNNQIDGSPYPIQVYEQVRSYYATVSTSEKPTLLSWSQESTTETKNSEYVGYVSISERDSLVTVYDSNGAIVGELTISFPGIYKLYYCDLAIYASNTNTGKSNVTAYRVQGEGDYTLWVGSLSYNNLNNTYNEEYEEYLLGSSLSISDNINLLTEPMLVRDTYGNTVSTINYITLFDYQEITPTAAQNLLKDNKSVYVYQGSGYVKVSEVKDDNSVKYYSLTIGRTSTLPTGVYQLTYSTDNRRREDDNYLVFTYVVATRIPALKIEMFYVQSTQYDSNKEYYTSSNVYKEYTGSYDSSRDLYEFVEAKDFDVTKTYYTLESVYGGYVLNEVKINTFEYGVTYYTFQKVTEYQENTKYYTYLYTKVNNLTEAIYNSGTTTYYIYEEATEYEEGKVYYRKDENGDYVATSFNADGYQLYTMEEATSYDPNNTVYYMHDLTKDEYYLPTNLTTKEDVFIANTNQYISNSGQYQANKDSIYYAYDADEVSYTMTNKFYLKNSFTIQMLERLSQTMNKDVYAYNGTEYVSTARYNIKTGTYYLGQLVNNSNNYQKADSYAYSSDGSSTLDQTTSQIALPNKTYYKLVPGTSESVADSEFVYVDNGNGDYSLSSTENGTPITDTNKTYYKRYSMTDSTDYHALTSEEKGYYKSPTSMSDADKTSNVLIGEDVYLSTIRQFVGTSGITVTAGNVLATNTNSYVLVVYSKNRPLYGSRNGSYYQMKNLGYTNSGYTYYYDSMTDYYSSSNNSSNGSFTKVTSLTVCIYRTTSKTIISGAYVYNLSAHPSLRGEAYDPTYLSSSKYTPNSTPTYIKIGSTNSTSYVNDFELVNGWMDVGGIASTQYYVVNTDTVAFDQTYYYYKPETTYNATAIIDSSADLVNGLYDSSNNVMTISKRTGERKVPSINDDVYTISPVAGNLTCGTTYYLTNSNYRIALNGTYYTLKDGYYYSATYYDPSATYYTREIAGWSYRITKQSSVAYVITNEIGSTISNARAYTLTSARNRDYDMNTTYYRIGDVLKSTYQGLRASTNLWWDEGQSDGFASISYSTYFVRIEEDVLFDQEYTYPTQYVIYDPDNGSFSVSSPKVDYSSMFLPELVTIYDDDYFKANGYYTINTNGLPVKQTMVDFAYNYYIKSASATDGYFNKDGYYYTSDDTLVRNAILFDVNNTVVLNPYLTPSTYALFTQETVYDNTGNTNYYTLSNGNYVSTLTVEFTERYYDTFIPQGGMIYNSSYIYLERSGTSKYILSSSPIDMTGLYIATSADKYQKYDKNNNIIPYYYFKTNQDALNKTPLVRFNVDQMLQNFHYYVFREVNTHTEAFNPTLTYYTKNTYRSLVSVPTGYTEEDYINLLIRLGDCFALDENTSTYGSTFDTNIYLNDGYWTTTNNIDYVKVQFSFNAGSQKYYYEPVKVTNGPLDSSKKYFENIRAGLSKVVLDENEFNEGIANGKLYYGIYNYFVAADEDVTLPSYLKVGGYEPQGNQFSYWITDYYSDSAFINYDDIKANYHGISYTDNAVVNLNTKENLILYPTFKEATYHLYVQIGSGYLITNTEGLKLQTLTFTKDSNTISFKVQVYDGYTAGDNFRVYIADGEGNVVKEWNTLNSSYTYRIDDLKNLYLYAVVDANEYTVTLDPNGGTIGNNKAKVTFGEISNIGVPTRSGAQFLYWYDAVSGTVYTDSDGTLLKRWSIIGDLTLMAAWSSIYDVSISYLSNGKNLTGNVVSSYTTDEMVRISIPTITGYTFLSATAYEVSTGKSVTLSKYLSTYSFIMPEDNVVVIVNYSPTSYEISYELDGGVLEALNPNAYTIEDTFTLNNPTKEGYTFTGWSGTGLSAIVLDVTISKGSSGYRSYIANWKLNETPIVYDFNATNVTNPNKDAISILDGNYVLKDPSLAKYQFMGWYLDEAYETKLEVNEDGFYVLQYTDYDEDGEIKLYGKFEKIQYIYFDLSNISTISIDQFPNFKTFFFGDADKDQINLLEELTAETPTISGYIYFMNMNELKKWSKLEPVGDNIFCAQIPENAFTYAILVFVDNDYITENGDGFNIDDPNPDMNWIYRQMQTDNLAIDRDTATFDVQKGLFILGSEVYEAHDDGNGMYYLKLTSISSKSVEITKRYTGSSLFTQALEESGISYVENVDSLDISYYDPKTKESTKVLETADVKEIGTYLIKIRSNGANGYSLIILNIISNEYDMTTVSLEDAVYEYDGSAKTLSVTGNVPSGVSVTYLYRSLGTDASSDSLTAPTMPGTYVVTAKFKSNEEGYESIQDLEAYLIIYDSNSLFTTPATSVYFGVYVDDRLTAIMTVSGSNAKEYQYINLALKEGQSIVIRDSDGTAYLNWSNTGVQKNEPYIVTVDGLHSFYFNVSTITTSITMPANVYSDYRIEYVYNGETYTEYLLVDSTFRQPEGSAQIAQFINTVTLPSGAKVYAFDGDGKRITLLENYRYFQLTSADISDTNCFTIPYDGDYTIYIKEYQNGTEVYVGFPPSPIYVLMPDTLTIESANVYYWREGVSGDINWPGATLTKLPDYAQIYDGFVAYTGNVSTEADYIIFNYVNGDGNRVQTNTLNYSYTEFKDMFIISGFETSSSESVVRDTWISGHQIVNTYTFDSSKYGIKITDIVGKTSLNVSEDGKITTVKVIKAVESGEENEYQYALFKATYVDSLGNEYYSFILRYAADGTELAPILIGSDDDFTKYIGSVEFAEEEGLYFLQTSDIAVDDEVNYTNPYTDLVPFQNVYNGAGYTIKYTQNEYHITSMQDDNSTNPYNGLFGYIGTKGVVMNIELEFAVTTPNNSEGSIPVYYIGAIASFNEGTVSNIHTNVYTIAGNNVRYVGGLIGYNKPSGKILDSVNSLGFTIWNWGCSDPMIIGGIAGYNAGLISNCSNTATITNNSNSLRGNYIGGIAALNSGTITGSTNTGDLKSNNDKIKKNNIAIDVSDIMTVVFENDWFFVNESIQTDEFDDPFIIQSNLKVDYYDSNNNFICYMLYEVGQTYQNSYDHYCVDIDIFKEASSIKLSRIVFITNKSNDRYYYSYTQEGTSFSFAQLDTEAFVGYPENTYEATFDNTALHSILSDDKYVYYYIEQSTTMYATENIVLNTAKANEIDTEASHDPISVINVYGVEQIYVDQEDFKVSYFDKDGVCIAVTYYDISEDIHINIYKNTSYMIFSNYVANEGTSKAHDSDKIVRVDVTAVDYKKDLYLYDGTPCTYNWGYDSSLERIDDISVINYVTASYGTSDFVEVLYYYNDGDTTTQLAKAQYSFTNTKINSIYNFKKNGQTANYLVVRLSLGTGKGFVVVSVPVVENYKDKELYVYNSGYAWMDKASELESYTVPVINQYLALLGSANTGIMVEHYNASNELIKIDAYANSNQEATRLAIYDGCILNNMESNLKLYVDTVYIRIRALSDNPNPIVIDRIEKPANGKDSEDILYIVSVGNDYTLGDATIYPGIYNYYLPQLEANATLNVFNEVVWYANAGAIMKVNYYDQNYNLIGIRTYDVALFNEIDILPNTYYIQTCRLCDQAEYNYAMVTYNGNEDNSLLLSGDNVPSWQEAGYRPIRYIVSIYNYIPEWQSGSYFIQYYDKDGNAIFAEPKEYAYNEESINIYEGTETMQIIYGTEVLNVTSINPNDNLYLAQSSNKVNSAIWSKPITITTGAYIPVAYSEDLTWWNYITVSYYAENGILITSIRYNVTATNISYIKNTARMVISVNGSETEILTIEDISLTKTLYFGLDILMNDIYGWTDNNYYQLGIAASLELENSISWWANTEYLTKIYYYSDDILLTIFVTESVPTATIPVYDGTTNIRIVRLLGLTEVNAIDVSPVYTTKILQLYSPSASVAAVSWKSKTLAADETPEYIYFDAAGLENVISVSLGYNLADGTKGIISMEYDENDTGYYRALWSNVLAINPTSINFIVTMDGEDISYSSILVSGIDIDVMNVYTAQTYSIDKFYKEYTAIYLNATRASSWSDYYILVRKGGETLERVAMTYMAEKMCYVGNVHTKYLDDMARIQFSSNPDDAYTIATNELVFSTEKPIYVLYAIGAILGLRDAKVNGNLISLYDANGARVDSYNTGYFDVDQYIFGNVGGWIDSLVETRSMDDFYLECVKNSMSEAMNDVFANEADYSTYVDNALSNILNANGELQFYAYSVGAMNGWSVGTYLYGLSYIGKVEVEKTEHYMFYNFLTLTDNAQHKVQLSTSWERNFSDDNNTAELEYSTTTEYVASKFNGAQNIESTPGKYYVIFEVVSGEKVVEKDGTNISCNESGIHVISIKNKFTVTWVVGEKTTTEVYFEGDIPEYPLGVDTLVKAPTSKYQYVFDKWSPVISAVTGDITYEALFTQKLRQYQVTYAYSLMDDAGLRTVIKLVDYGYMLQEGENPIELEGYYFAGWFLDLNCQTSAVGVAIHKDTTLYARTIKTNPTFTLETETEAKVIVGNTVLMTASLEQESDLVQYSYQWYLNGVLLDGETGKTLSHTFSTTDAIMNDYYCVVTLTYDGTVLGTVESNHLEFEIVSAFIPAIDPETVTDFTNGDTLW